MWHVINTNYNTASMNMAIDEVLLDRPTPTLRFYRWKPAALSLGFFQKIDDIDLEQCKKQGIDIVRRLTGGKTVLHDKELTYSFVADETILPKDVIESYKLISSGIIIALKHLGIGAQIKNNPKKPSSPICFKEPSWYEITVNNKKIVGSAQKRIKNKVLQHGSVLIDIDFDLLSLLFKGNVDVNLLKERITSTKKTYSQIADAMVKGFSENFGVEFKESHLTKEELGKAKELEKKYSKP